MAKPRQRVYVYEATVRITVRGAECAEFARRVAGETLQDIRQVTYDNLAGEAKVSGGTLRRAAQPRQGL